MSLIVLISTPYIETEAISQSDRYPPLGLYYLAAMLSSHGYKVKVLDVPSHQNSMPWLFRELLKLDGNPLAVGMLVYTQTALLGRRVARLARNLFPETTIIQGGPHPTVCYEEALSNPDVDIVARGEGEATIIELMESLRHPKYPLNCVRGIAYREADGAVHCTPNRPPIKHLDLLPVPAYQLSEGEYEQNNFYLISSRGCPGGCIFCASRSFFGSAQRSHSAEWLFSVLYAFHKRHPFKRFLLIDDTFTVNRVHVRKFCDLLVQWNQELTWTARSRVDVIREELVNDLSRAGCTSIHIGVESGDDGVLKTVGKHITLDQVKKAVALLVEHDIYVAASFILGHASDSVDTLEKTILYTQALSSIADTASGPSTPYPGTPLQVQAGKLGIKIHVRDWTLYNLSNPIYDTTQFTMDQLNEAGVLSVAVRLSRDPAPLLGKNRHNDLRQELAAWVQQLEDKPGAVRYRRTYGIDTVESRDSEEPSIVRAL